jgi:hypothetical protein
MAITPKQVLDTAVAVGREAVGKGIELAGKLRSDDRVEPPTTPATPVRRSSPRAKPAPSGSPSTVGAAKPGKPRGPKSASAGTARKSKRPKAQPAAASRKPGPTSKSG